MALHVARSYPELVRAAREAENNDSPAEAAALYEQAKRQEPHHEMIYNRLMILYRKLKQYDDELRVIREGIKAFESLHEERTQRIYKGNGKVKQLSSQLAKSLGQSDRKGKQLVHPEPVNRWLARQGTVEEKIARQKTKKTKTKKKK
ncbi:MAG TPA: hypothetical protein VFZ78_02035 [Flavisolibacter sp.]